MQKRERTVTRLQTSKPVPGASVTVYVRNEDGSNGAKAVLFSDDGVTEQDNPTFTNELGAYSYYAADGRYNEVISGAGIDTRTISDVLLEDPADNPVFDAANVAITGGAINGVAVSKIQDPASVRITGGSVAIQRWPFRRVAISRRPATVHPAPPTISYALAAPTGVRLAYPLDSVVQRIGVPAYTENTSLFILDHGNNSGAGFEAEFFGDVITFGTRTSVSAAEKVMVYVDGQPCMAAPATPSVSTTAGTSLYTTLTFPSVAKRRVEIIVTGTNAMRAIYLPLNGSVAPTPKKPTVLLVGDSFLGGSAASSDTSSRPGARLWQMYDCNVLVSGLGGTGYVSAGSFTPFGDSSRVSFALDAQPDKIVFIGSVNDDGLSGIQTAAAACFAAYKAAAPNADLYAFGPQPSSATATIGANRSANIAAVKAAATAAGVTFYDMVGTADGVPAAFSTATTYQPGALVTRYGSVWRHSSTVAAQYSSGTNGPGQNARWELVTYDYYGTGNTGSVVGDGPRDILLYSDGIHPTEAAQWLLAQRIGYVLTN